MSVDAARGWGTGPGSSRVTSAPRRASSSAAVTPKIPAPTTAMRTGASCHGWLERHRDAVFLLRIDRSRDLGLRLAVDAHDDFGRAYAHAVEDEVPVGHVGVFRIVGHALTNAEHAGVAAFELDTRV